jgi:uncharacterized repeat protein (TIGR01451 family)
VPIVTLVVVAACALLGPRVARAQSGTELINETFAGPAVLDPNFSVQGATCLTGRAIGAPLPPGAANIPDCRASQGGPVPTPGALPGYLQLTDAVNNKTGSILYNRPVPSSAGLVATFDQWQYGGSGADGIAFFLVDGATNLTTPGAFGGSLGYAQRTGVDGIAGAYLGVGLDAFGNFYNDNEGRGRGCSTNQRAPFPTALVPGAIVIRGPGNQSRGYCYLDSTATKTNPPMTNLPGSLRGPTLATARRRVSVTVTPGPAPRVTVTIDFFDGNGPRQVLDIPAPPNPPATYKFGWTASTGGSTDVHLIQNAVVRTVNPLAQLTLDKQVDVTKLPNPLVLGSVIPYQFVVTNSGLETLTNLAVSDPRVPGVVCPRTTIDPAPADTSTVVCTGSYTVTQADVDAGQIVNTAAAQAVDPGGRAVQSNPSTLTLTVGSTPRIALQKLILTPPPYSFGQTVTYRYDVINTGSVSVTLNAATAIVDDKLASITCQQPLTLLPQPQFPSSTSCVGTYVIQAAAVDANGFLTNTATATARPATGGTVTSAPASLTLPVGVDIGVAKTVDVPTPRIGDIVTFTVTATNAGPANATGVRITDPIGPGVALVGAVVPPGTTYTPGTGVWNVGNLAAGGSVQLQLSLQVTSVDPYTNVATLTAVTEPDINPNNDRGQATITPIRDADVGMAKSVNDPTPAVGETITFSVTATNLGPSPATGVVVVDLLPAGLALSSATPSQGAYDAGTGTWSVGSLAVNGSATLTLTALVTAPGTITNTATKTAQNEPDPNPNNDTASSTITATRVADLSITKTDGLAVVLAGNQVTYTIAVFNAGPSDVVGATVTDTFPAALTGVTWTCVADTGGSCGAASGSGNIATTVNLPAGRGAVFTATGTVSPSALGTLSNTATVAPPAGTTDPNPGNDSSTDVTTIQASADLAADKLGPPGLITAGTPVSFTITVTNAGPSTATGVTLVDPTPAGLTFVSNTGACTTAFPCALGSLAPGATAVVTTTFFVPPGYTTPDPIVNVATVSSPTPDPVPGNNTGTGAASLGAPVADLLVTKTDGLSQVVAGGQVTYTITILNRGPSNVSNVAVADPLPAPLGNASWTCSSVGGICGAASGSGGIVTTVSLPVGATATFLLTGTVAPDAEGELVNTVQTTNPPGFGEPSTATATDVTDIVAVADLSIAKTGPAVVVPGNQVAYTIVVTNQPGRSTARNVVVTDQTPPGLTFVSNSGACTTAFPCALGDLGPAETRTITATFAVPEGYAAPDPIVNRAQVTSATPDANPADNAAESQTAVNRFADVALRKTVAPATALVGDTVTFTVEAVNNGPNVATSVTVVDVLPAGLLLTGTTASQGVYLASPAGEWSVGRLGVGERAQLTLTAVVTQPGAITNIATNTTGNEPDPDTSNDTATATVNAGTLADVGVAKSVDVPNPALGQTVTFTVRVTNFGPSAATGVVVEDALPAELSFAGASPSQGTYDQGTGAWTIGGLAPGGSATLTLQATALVPYAVVNTARKTAQVEPDPNPANDQASVTVNGAGTADIAVAKAVSNPAPAVGELVTFTVIATNVGPEQATGVVVRDVLPAGLDLVAALPAADFDAMTGDWTVGTLELSQSRVLVLTVRPATAGTFTNTATKTAPPACPPPPTTPSGLCDPNPTNDTGAATVMAILVGDLSITKTDGLGVAVAGQAVTYTIVVANAGPSPVANARVVDAFPAVLGSVTWTCTPDPGSFCAPPSPENPGGASAGGGDIDVPVALLPPGGRVVFVVGTALRPDASGTLANTATVTPPSGVTDPDLANNTATDQTPIESAANLEVVKTGPPTAVSGQTLVYVVEVLNAGPSIATDVVVADPTPADLAFVSNAGACTTAFPCGLGTLAPGDRRVITSTYTVVPGAGETRVAVNTATVSSPIPDPNPQNNTSTAQTTITASANLAIVKTAGGTGLLGEPLVYELQIFNDGPDGAVAVELRDTLPAGVELVSVTTTQGSCGGTTSLSCSLGNLSPGGLATVTVTVLPQVTGDVTNTATVASNTPDPDPGNNTSTVTVTVGAAADLALSKTVTPATAAVGETLTYTLTVVNRGPSTATAVTLTDDLPQQVTPGTATASQGTCTLAGRALTCALGTLAPDGSATVTVTATRDVAQPFTNQASVIAAEPDPTPDDATASVSTDAASGEICDNCVDDDGDGQIDWDDADCCTEIGTLTVTKVRATPRNGNPARSRLFVRGTLGGADFSTLDPRREDVSVTIGDGMLLACCTIPQQKWMKLYRKHFGFWDQRSRVCPPVVDMSLRQTTTGGGFTVVGRQVDVTQLGSPDLRVTLRVGGSCASGTATLRRTGSGALVFP